MEKIDGSAAVILVQVSITLLPWLLGAAMGSGLGALCAFGIQRLLSASPRLRRPLVLVPWRTLTMAFLIAVWSPFATRLLGLGPAAGGVMIAATVVLLATPMVTAALLEHGGSPPVASRLVSSARTLAVATGLLALGASVVGGGGLGPTILEAARLAEYRVMWQGLLVVLGFALAADIALGFAQMYALGQRGEGGAAITAGG